MNVISDGDRSRLARLITQLQDEPARADETLASEGYAEDAVAGHVVGISGAGGVGKSTLISRMLHELRKDNLRVVVLAIDPTSERSRGALLGDRIRMRDSYGDGGVFIRSPQLQCRDYLLAGPWKDLKNYKPQDWNEMVVTVKGGTAHCTCNGEVLNAAMKVPATGPIGLEGDRGQMEYRRIRLKELE